METAVVYFSQGGSTRRYAAAEAKAQNAALIELRPARPYNPITAFLRGCPAAMRQKSVPLIAPAPDLSAYARIVLMAPVWAGFPAPPFFSAVALLPRGCEVEVVLVSSSGNSSKSAPAVRACITQAGCTLTAQRDIRASK